MFLVVKSYVGRLSIKSLQYRPIYNDTHSTEYIELRIMLKNAVSSLLKLILLLHLLQISTFKEYSFGSASLVYYVKNLIHFHLD